MLMSSPETHLDIIDTTLLEIFVAEWLTPESIPDHHGPITNEALHVVVLGHTTQLASLCIAERQAMDTTTYYEKSREYGAVVEGVGVALDQLAPFTSPRRGDLFPDTYRQWLEACFGDNVYAQAKADETIGWEAWMWSIARELAGAIVPERRTSSFD